MKWLTFVLTAVLFVGCVTSANGDVVNGSFESGFAGWTGVGPNSAFPSFDGELPTDGGSLAFLSNGSGSLSVAIHDIILTAAIGSPAGSIAGLFGGTEGAIAFQTFSLDPNQNGVNFDWNFLTTEATPSAFNDFAFASIWDSTGSLVSSFVLDTFSTFPGSGTAFPSHTGWLSGSFSSLTPGGTYSLVFGVFDEGDTTFDSALLIDNVRGNVVPEPTGLAFVLGFVCLAGLNSRRRK